MKLVIVRAACSIILYEFGKTLMFIQDTISSKLKSSLPIQFFTIDVSNKYLEGVFFLNY